MSGKSGRNLGRDYYRALQAWGRPVRSPLSGLETAHTAKRGRYRYEKGSPEALRAREQRRRQRRRFKTANRAAWDRNLVESHAARAAQKAARRRDR